MAAVSDNPRRTAELLASTVGFELLSDELGRDVESSLRAALASGAVLHDGADPLLIFRKAIADAIVAIQRSPRDQLFQDFLLKGPYEKEGPIPPEARNQRLSDDQTHAAITLVFSYMVNCFKGAVAELLAVAPCLEILKRLQARGTIPKDARLYVGDSVRSRRLRGTRFAKGADMHIILPGRNRRPLRTVTVAGVAEIKSYRMSGVRLQKQLSKHLQRARRGLKVKGVTSPVAQPFVGIGPKRKAVRIAVMPANWTLPRTIRFAKSESGRRLILEPPSPPQPKDHIEEAHHDRWMITLRWSEEALEAVAHEMTFWYMETLGELIYAGGVPWEWSEMSPAEAGRNAAKEKLYYAILRCRPGSKQEQRAIALYNSYGFGYALGTSFKDVQGRRQMLRPEDLDEIAANGQTKSGCRLAQTGSRTVFGRQHERRQVL